VKDLEEHLHKTISSKAFHQYDQLQQGIATNALSLNQGQWILGVIGSLQVEVQFYRCLIVKVQVRDIFELLWKSS
jgi:hypothetical protein